MAQRRTQSGFSLSMWLVLGLVAAGCSGSMPSGDAGIGPDGGEGTLDAGPDAGLPNDGGMTADGGDAGGLDSGYEDAGDKDAGTNDAGSKDAGDEDAGPPVAVTFAYAPSWEGVSAVEVIGGFGLATDWKQPLLTMLADAGFTGTTMLPPGQYDYLFKTIGDSAGRNPAAYLHTAIDPTNPSFEQCPAASPTAGNSPNPCSILTVPQGAAAPLQQITGHLTFDGGPAAGWFAIIERNEKSSHHFLANQVLTGRDGSYTLQASAGVYEVWAELPTFETLYDDQVDALKLQSFRRLVSSTFDTTNAVDLGTVEVSNHLYGAMEPLDGGLLTLPTLLAATAVPQATRASITLSGGAKDDAGFVVTLGDAWWSSGARPLDAGMMTAVFDGGFTGAAATEPAAVAGEEYLWATDQVLPSSTDAGMTWSAESLGFPIAFQ